MPRRPLYTATRAAPRSAPASSAPVAEPQPAPPVRSSRWRERLRRHERPLWLVAGLLIALTAVGVDGVVHPKAPALTQKDIDAAVLHTLEKQPLPSPAAKAYDTVKGAVVRVRGFATPVDDGEVSDQSTGSGVVVQDNGTILTNLHVVSGGSQIRVEFADGTISDANVVGVQPEHDLAVIRAHTLPDDLQPATLRSTRDLREGDRVIAVGFPFGIGPSVTAGIVSGLRREYRAPDGRKTLTNLIQFDAAANPGNSGGPLVTADGEVVGIVTAILNPGDQPTFIGIAFAVPIENAASSVGLSPF